MKSKNFNIEDFAIDTVIWFVFIFILIVTLYPFYYILVQSFNQGIDATRGGIYFWPRVFSLENYTQLLSDSKWANGLVISVARTVIGTLAGVFFTSLVAFGLSNKNLLFKKLYFAFIIFAMYFSGGIIPYYVLLRGLHLTNTFGVYVVPALLNLFFLLVMISFFREIPESLHESANIDGANDLTVFIRIIIPVSMPAIATISLFMGVNHWNSWMDSAFFVRSKELRTMSYLMMEIINRSMISQAGAKGAVGVSVQEIAAVSNAAVTTKSLQMAAMVIAVVPILSIYPFLQKYFVKGIMLGSVKG